MTALPILTALIAGFLHALEADHMAAVTTFVSRHPRPAQALGFGIRWALGHSAALLGVGGFLVLLDLPFPERLTRGLEFGVGIMLLGLGAWLLWSILHGKAHDLGQGAQDAARRSRHPGATLWVGMAHGLAGTAPLIALIPVVITDSSWLACAYLILFGVGTVLAMGLYAFIMGVLFHRVGRRSSAVAGALRGMTALASVGIGLLWLYAASAGPK